MTKVLSVFPERMNPSGIAAFVDSQLDGFDVTGSSDPTAAELAGVEVIIAALAAVTADHIAAADSLKLIQTPSHGFDHVDIAAAAERGVPVCNVGTSGAEAGTVAEHAMGLMLACARRLVDAHEGIRGGDWPQLAGSTIELQGKTLGIIGLGHIGREVAERARAFGMTLLYFDTVAAPDDVESALGIERVELDRLLQESDAVTVHVPLMPSTHGLIGAEELAKLKDGAILVNTSRGPVVDNLALAEALATGRIAAGIDVFDPEPPPADHPLRGAPNVVLTPHLAGTTRESVIRIMAAALENIRRFGRGEPVQDVVNGVDTREGTR